MKRIAIQQGLEGLSNDLQREGYEVVGFNMANHVDAVIYIDDYDGLRTINNQQGDDYGAILINAKGKTIEDIKYIIEKRRYGSLFS
ncbi:YkuS family protein [Alkaliphilus serpentinus]|uniref:YkuS family protein n=1 Tax=Alkaliphilus serpentinus TaxID=1482731 RepID=A0A833HQT6_9FIRM|nr:YkuS family protein [Alkaliphilus serpentinus]KAB3532208.1 YkuS family protein [Alkaliphilus serpentinus]